MSQINDFVKDVANEIPGFKSVAVINVIDNATVASNAVDNDPDFQDKIAQQTQIYLQALRSVSKIYKEQYLNLISELLLTTKDDFYMFDVSPDGKFMAIFVVDKNESNLGLTRSIIAKHRKDVATQLDASIG